MTPRAPRRDGFAMMTVLWVMSVAAILAVAAAAAGRAGFEGARNRAELERARWVAAGCAAEARSAIDDALASTTSPEDAAATWRILPRRIELPPHEDCTISLEAAGTRLDINSGTPDMLDSLLTNLGYGDASITMAQSVADWRDSDDVARPDGAEAEWYRTQHRAPPRNAPFVDIAELGRVRGFENAHGLDSVLSVDAGPISLATAPAPVLTAIPGITRETADAIVARRVAGEPVGNVLAVLGAISRASALAIEEHYPEIARLTTPDPAAWTIRARAWSGLPKNEASIEWRLGRIDRRTVLTAARHRI